MRPPWSATSSRAIASPRPVPPKRRVALSSPLRKRSKIASREATGTPGPLSSTERTTSSRRARSPTRTRPPSGTNFIAFESRFSRTRSSFAGIGRQRQRVRRLDRQLDRRVPSPRSRRARPCGARRRRGRRAIDRAPSGPSRASRPRAGRSRASAAPARCARPSRDRAASVVRPTLAPRSLRIGPRMSASGVRSSWLTFARKSDFVRLAASASSFAFDRPAISSRLSKRSATERTSSARNSEASAIDATPEGQQQEARGDARERSPGEQYADHRQVGRSQIGEESRPHGRERDHPADARAAEDEEQEELERHRHARVEQDRRPRPSRRRRARRRRPAPVATLATSPRDVRSAPEAPHDGERRKRQQPHRGEPEQAAGFAGRPATARAGRPRRSRLRSRSPSVPAGPGARRARSRSRARAPSRAAAAKGDRPSSLGPRSPSLRPRAALSITDEIDLAKDSRPRILGWGVAVGLRRPRGDLRSRRRAPPRVAGAWHPRGSGGGGAPSGRRPRAGSGDRERGALPPSRLLSLAARGGAPSRRGAVRLRSRRRTASGSGGAPRLGVASSQLRGSRRGVP